MHVGLKLTSTIAAKWFGRDMYMAARPQACTFGILRKPLPLPRFASVQVRCCGQRLFNSLRGLPPGEMTGRDTEVPQGSTLSRNDLMDVTMNESLNASVLTSRGTDEQAVRPASTWISCLSVSVSL